MRIEIVHDSVVFQDCDAIVNAANVTLLGGGGVDGAIHCAAGPELYWYFHDLGRTCQPGEAIESPGFNLPAKFVIHTVGPVYRDGLHGEPEKQAACYHNSLPSRSQTAANPSPSSASPQECTATRKKRPRKSPCGK